MTATISTDAMKETKDGMTTTLSTEVVKEDTSRVLSLEQSAEVLEKAASIPIAVQQSEIGKLVQQISAPSYLLSLKDNQLPPFRKPGKEARPEVLTGTIMNENDAVAMIAAAEFDPENGLNNFLKIFLVQKNVIANYVITERSYLISLIKEVIDYAAQRDFNENKLACMITIYLSTHSYFKWYYWSSPAAIWNYFREVMIKHSIEDPPYGAEVFEPDESYDVVTHFHTIYITNLPLIHLLTFGAHRLKFVWPFTPAKVK